MSIEQETVPPGTPGATPTIRPAGLPTGPGGGITPQDLATAYGFDPAVGGKGQTVAVVDQNDDPNIEQDLATYSQNFGLPACTAADGCFRKVNEHGEERNFPLPDKELWGRETALDVETVHSVCEACKILLVEVEKPAEHLTHLEDTFGAGEDTAVALGAGVVSDSFGVPDDEYDQMFEGNYEHRYVVMVAAAGDFGWDDWEKSPSGLPGFPENGQPQWPASYRYVISVGGTELKLGPNAERESERVWNQNPMGQDELKASSGGGCVDPIGLNGGVTILPWQGEDTLPNWAATGCGQYRLDNDVSADAGTAFSIFDSEPESGSAPGWTAEEGTSLATPIVAGLFALAGGANGVEFPAITLYSHLGAFSDVQAGGNGFCNGEPASACPEPNRKTGKIADCEGTLACDAAPGYDGPTGVGSPNGVAPFKAVRPSEVTQTTAVLRYRVNTAGRPMQECGFIYSQTEFEEFFARCKPDTDAGSDLPVTVSAKVHGLEPGKGYVYAPHFCAGPPIPDCTEVSYWGIFTAFQTPKVQVPVVQTKGATGVTATAATLNATINPRGGTLTQCRFEYGEIYGSFSSYLPCSLANAEAEPHLVRDSTPTLNSLTRYYYRIAATNAKGTAVGQIESFETL